MLPSFYFAPLKTLSHKTSLVHVNRDQVGEKDYLCFQFISCAATFMALEIIPTPVCTSILCINVHSRLGVMCQMAMSFYPEIITDFYLQQYQIYLRIKLLAP